VGVGAVLEQELHPAHLGAHGAELLAGPEGAVDHVAVRGAAQLGAHERPALAGLDVLELDDLKDGAVDVDVAAVAELVGRNHVRGQCRTARRRTNGQRSSGLAGRRRDRQISRGWTARRPGAS
jgi:hypothetical protein